MLKYIIAKVEIVENYQNLASQIHFKQFTTQLDKLNMFKKFKLF